MKNKKFFFNISSRLSFFSLHTKNSESGQALIEGLMIAVVVTVLLFAAIQACIITIDDMYANYVAFFATRKVAVAENKNAADVASKTVQKFFVPYMLNSKSILTYKTTHWDETILGKKTEDHSGNQIKKHNVKIAYNTRIIFYKLFNLFTPVREQSARARLVKSPGQNFYNKAYPGAKEFGRLEKSQSDF